MNKHLIMVMVLVWVVLTPLVLAIPPGLSSSDAGTLRVSPTWQNYLVQGENVSLHFHVYNSSGGLVNASGVNCTWHVYNASDVHVVSEELVGSSNGVDLVGLLNDSVTSVRGKLAFQVWCSPLGEQTESGWYTGEWEVTPTGKSSDKQGLSFLIVVVLLPLFFSLLLMWWVSTLGEVHAVFKIGLSLFSFTGIFISLWLGTLVAAQFWDLPVLQDAQATLTWIMGVSLFVFISYWSIYFISQAFHVAAQKRKERLEY